MDELIHNKTKNENSRIFSTTENKNSIPNAEADIQFWTCKKCGMAEREEDDMWCEHCIKADYKEKDKIIDGLVDKISELTGELQAIEEHYKNLEINFEDYKKESRDEVANALWEQMKGDDL